MINTENMYNNIYQIVDNRFSYHEEIARKLNVPMRFVSTVHQQRWIHLAKA